MTFNPRRILYEDDYILAVNKLPRELAVAGQGEVQKLSLLDFLRQTYPGLTAINRLDFETSGVMLFAKSNAITLNMIKELVSKSVKQYKTLVMGKPKLRKGTITKKLPARTKGLVDAVTHYTVDEVFSNSSLLSVIIETGRHHQIRKHFSSIGHPLVLDHEYGHKKFNGIFTQEFKTRLFLLHCSMVEFVHPITKATVKIEAPLPLQFTKILSGLRSLMQ